MEEGSNSGIWHGNMALEQNKWRNLDIYRLGWEQQWFCQTQEQICDLEGLAKRNLTAWEPV